MKLRSLIVVSLFFILSCKVTEKPEFININGLKIKHSTAKEVEIQANAHFLNKNSVGGKLQINKIKVFVDSIFIATIDSKIFDVPKEEAFTIPLTVNIPYDKVFKNNKKDLLNNIMNMLLRKKILVQFKGGIRYKLGDFYYDYELDYTDNISIQIK